MERIGALIVDVQGDFTEAEEGSLAVSGTGRDYLAEVGRAALLLKEKGIRLYATQDWHPRDHVSFFTSHPGRKAGDVIEIDGRTQVLWPVHCVQGTENARILVDGSLLTAIVQKGSHPRFESYSGFRDEGNRETGLEAILRSHGIERLVIFGLATDYCVKWTVSDALERGFPTIVVEGLCRGVTPETTSAALKEMKGRGAIVIPSLDLGVIGKENP